MWARLNDTAQAVPGNPEEIPGLCACPQQAVFLQALQDSTKNIIGVHGAFIFLGLLPAGSRRYSPPGSDFYTKPLSRQCGGHSGSAYMCHSIKQALDELIAREAMMCGTLMPPALPHG
jgi:hypothetical protein